MSEDYSAVVAASLSDAGIQLDSSVPDAGDGGHESSGDATVDTAVVTEQVVEKPVVADDKRDEFTKWFEDEEGVKPPVEGQRENRLPYSRSAKIAKNAYERGQKEAAAKVEKLTKDLEQSTSRFSVYENADRLASTDEVQFLKTLATLHPKFQRFLEPLKEQAEAVVEAKKAPDDDKADPKPEKKTFPDGSVGYDDEGVEALLAWNRRQTLREANSAFVEQLKPFKKIADREAAYEKLQQEIPKVKAESARVRQVWGEELVNKHQDAIAKAIDDHPEFTPSDAAGFVLVPIMNAQVEAERGNTKTAREKVIADLNRRPAAADGQERAPVIAAGAATEEDDSVQGAVRRSLVEAGLIPA